MGQGLPSKLLEICATKGVLEDVKTGMGGVRENGLYITGYGSVAFWSGPTARWCRRDQGVFVQPTVRPSTL